MHSKDIARQAGVTVRTLRHYHQLGLLSEPSRDANGYRSYAISHLIRLLRIRRLVSLGLSLRDLPPLLDGNDERRGDVLDELEDNLSRQIDHLHEQRRIVSALREGAGPLDVSPDLAKPLLALEAGRSEKAIKAGQDQSVLLTHVISEEGQGRLADLYERLAAPDLANIVQELGQHFDRLSPDASEGEMDDLADAYVRHLGSWMRAFNGVLSEFDDGASHTLLWTHAIGSVPPQQHRVLTEIGKKFTKAG